MAGLVGCADGTCDNARLLHAGADRSGTGGRSTTRSANGSGVARSGAIFGRVKGLRWLLAAVLSVLLVGLATAAADRPYADNQRNWLIMVAVLLGLALAVVLLAGLLLGGARAIVSEWKPRR